jgi:hypothetical protein
MFDIECLSRSSATAMRARAICGRMRRPRSAFRPYILIDASRRIASLELLPNVEVLPHLKCSRAMVA